MGRVKVKEVFEKDESFQEPILVKFQHAVGSRQSSGIDLNKVFRTAVFQSDGQGTPKKDFSHLKRNGVAIKQEPGVPSPSQKLGKRTLVALQSREMTYIGSNEGEEPLKTYVALRKGKKMKVYEVTPVTVAPFIKGHSFVDEKEKETSVKKTREERFEVAVELVKSFGSKKKRLTLERIEKNKISVADMNESMTKATMEIQAPDEEPVLRDDSVLTLVPPCNREAKTAEGVYRLDDILSTDEMADMDELADMFLNLSNEDIKAWKAEKKYSDYFFVMWARLNLKKNDTRAHRVAKIVLYTELLICMLKFRHDQLRKREPPFPEVFPKWLQEKVLDIFTTVNAKGIRNRPDAMRDKTCCYIMVLVLLANDFLFDVQLMSTSLNIHIKKLLMLAKAVGITLNFNSTSKEHRGVLRIPLPKPIENRGRRRALR